MPRIVASSFSSSELIKGSFPWKRHRAFCVRWTALLDNNIAQQDVSNPFGQKTRENIQLCPEHLAKQFLTACCAGYPHQSPPTEYHYWKSSLYPEAQTKNDRLTYPLLQNPLLNCGAFLLVIQLLQKPNDLL